MWDHRLRAMVVRRLRAGVAPSNTKTGLTLWKSSLRSRRLLKGRGRAWGADQATWPEGQAWLSRGTSVSKGKAQPADAPEEAQQVRVLQHFAFLVAHGLEELVQPYRGVCKHQQNIPLPSVSGTAPCQQ